LRHKGALDFISRDGRLLLRHKGAFDFISRHGRLLLRHMGALDLSPVTGHRSILKQPRRSVFFTIGPTATSGAGLNRDASSVIRRQPLWCELPHVKSAPRAPIGFLVSRLSHTLDASLYCQDSFQAVQRFQLVPRSGSTAAACRAKLGRTSTGRGDVGGAVGSPHGRTAHRPNWDLDSACFT